MLCFLCFVSEDDHTFRSLIYVPYVRFLNSISSLIFTSLVANAVDSKTNSIISCLDNHSSHTIVKIQLKWVFPILLLSKSPHRWSVVFKKMFFSIAAPHQNEGRRVPTLRWICMKGITSLKIHLRSLNWRMIFFQFQKEFLKWITTQSELSEKKTQPFSNISIVI